MPMSTGGSLAIQGLRSCRDRRWRDTMLPLSSIPTACNTRLAISIPRTCISCFMGLASCGSMGSLLWNSLWLIAVEPHRGGSISLRPHLHVHACFVWYNPCNRFRSASWVFLERDVHNPGSEKE